jgi:cobalt-zinc-cadmium efflux system outer membrane protein
MNLGKRWHNACSWELVATSTGQGNRFIGIASGLLLCFCFAAAVLGQATDSNGPPQRISLSDVKQIAFQRNWDLLTAKSGIDAATAQWMVASEFPNPTAGISTANFATHNIATSEGNGIWQRSYDTIFAISQLIEIGGKRHDRQAAGRAGARGAKARFYDAKRILDQGVTKAYVAALLAGYNEQVLAESARFMKREEDIAQSRFSAGDLSDSDLKQIQIGAEQFELQEAAAHAATIQARIQVEILMGDHQPKGNWTPTDTLEQMDAVIPPLPQATAGAARPDVLAAEADLRGGQFNLRLQKAMRIPDPTVSILYEHNPVPPGPPPDDTFGLGVSFPLPLWNLNGGNIKAAEAAMKQFELALGKVKAQNASDVANAQVEYQEAHDRLLRYQTLIVPQSAKSRASVSFAFEKGSATLVDLLEAERTDNTVRMAMAQAQSDTASAVADVMAAQNVLSETELESNKR